VGGTIYQVHKNILSLRSKKLYEIAEESDNVAPIPISSVESSIFKSVLDFAYNVKVPEIANEGKAVELLVAADRFDCSHLKLYVESIIVDKFLTGQNAAEMFVFADSYSCALLKEEATNEFVTDPDIVKKADSWSKIEESTRLLSELLDSLSRFHGPKLTNNEDDVDRMDVVTLREQLREANLELDGSREVLVERLKAHRQDEVTEK
jgi:hypothetical protein